MKINTINSLTSILFEDTSGTVKLTSTQVSKLEDVLGSIGLEGVSVVGEPDESVDEAKKSGAVDTQITPEAVELAKQFYEAGVAGGLRRSEDFARKFL